MSIDTQPLSRSFYTLADNTVQHFNDHVVPVIDNFKELVAPVVAQCRTTMEAGRLKIVAAADDNLPTSAAQFVTRASRVIPETIVATAAFFGSFPIITVPAVAYKTFTILQPVVNELLNARGSVEGFKNAVDRARDDIHTEIEKLKPALVVAAGTAALVSGIMGVLTLSPSRLVTSAVFGFTAATLYNATLAEIRAEEAIQADELQQ